MNTYTVKIEFVVKAQNFDSAQTKVDDALKPLRRKTHVQNLQIKGEPRERVT